MLIWLVRSALESVQGPAWIAQIPTTCVSGWWTTVLDASWYRVDSRLVTIDEQEVLLVSYAKFCECEHYSLFSALWLVDDSVAVSLRYIWTRDDMMSFLRIVQVVLLLFILMSILSSHGCYMCTHGHPHISSHGPLKTSSHFAEHIHVSPVLTR